MSWETVKLGEVCLIEKGNIGIMKAVPGEYPLIVLGEERKTHNEFQFNDQAVIIPLVSSTGHGHRSMKRIFFQTGKFSVGSILCAVIPKDKSQLSAEFLYRYLDFNKENELVARMKGMANVSLPMKEIASVEIPLPPLEIQNELVQKFQSLEAAKNQVLTELNRQLALVGELRQAYLREAMQGQLAAQDEREEPAEKLLEKIKAEKEKLVAAKKVKKINLQFTTRNVQADNLFEIPANWAWCKLGTICHLITDGTHHTPSYKEQGIPFISVKNISKGSIDFSDTKFISEEEHSELIKRCNPEVGDILLTKVGTTGIAKVVDTERRFSIFVSVALLKFNQLLINSKFLEFVINSPFVKKQSDDGTWGVGNKNLVLKTIMQFSIPLPPLAEQGRIVAKLEKLLKSCDELEANIKDARADADRLLHTALKEALVAR